MSDVGVVIRGQRVAISASANKYESARLGAASIHVRNGVITAISDFGDVPPNCPLEEASAEAILIPGLVDTHVHINEPGRTEWEGFATATRAAAAGGVTTLIDMPLNSIPPTTTAAGLGTKMAAAAGQCFVDVGFWGGVVPGNAGDLVGMMNDGVVGFKCFLIHSGVDEFPNVTETDLRAALPELRRLDAMLIVHAEVPGPIDRACPHAGQELPNQRGETDAENVEYRTFLESRPRAAENEAVELMIRLAREFGTRIHIVHHSSADALPALRMARQDGLNLTVETCPHYLYFAAEDIPPGATEFKCCPPIRERENQEQLWQALKDGTIDLIVSDHSPCTPDLKLKESGDFLKAWGGIASLQLRLPIIWTAASARGFSLEHLLEWLCIAPARQVGLQQNKGAIAVGHDADIVFWNPDEEFQVEPGMLFHRHKLSPYRGEWLRGVVQKTFLRGRKIYDGGEFLGHPQGTILRSRQNRPR